MDGNRRRKTRQVLKLLKQYPGVVVALSGGVDSAVLLSLAAQALGAHRVVAATAVSPALPAAERLEAARVAAFVGVQHEQVATQELENPRYRANAGDRCFHCRLETFAALRRIAAERGAWAVAYGAIADDLGERRPGMAAAGRFDVRAPLLEAGLTKQEVREIARERALPVHAKPAAACLSSRIPVGTPVTRGRLARIERAETALAQFGFGQFRVRHHEDVARLEFDAAGRRRLRDPELCRRVVKAVRAAGYAFVTVDLQGYRAGGSDPRGPRP